MQRIFVGVLIVGLAMAFAHVAARQASSPAAGSPSADGDKTPLVTRYEAAMIAPVPASFGFDPFYKKYTDALGIPVLSSEKVPDAALLMARDIVIYMTSKAS